MNSNRVFADEKRLRVPAAFARRVFVCVMLISVFGFAPSLLAQFERQSVAGGGALFGAVLNPDASDEQGVQIAVTGGGQIVLDPHLVEKQEKLRPEEISWRLTAPGIADTVEANENYARVCRDNGLPQQARRHWERVVELDPNNELARRTLGYVKLDGVWMSERERKEQLGYESFGGRSMTAQEAALERQQNENKKQIAAWKKNLKPLYAQIKNGDSEAKNQIRRIRDPLALAAITELLKNENNPQIRIVFVQAMGNIATPAALGDLASVALVDDDYEVRLTALETLHEHRDELSGAIAAFRKSLFHSRNDIVNRAGAALGYLDTYSAVPDLINALVTNHQRTTVEGGDEPIASFSNRGFTFNPGNKPVIKVITESIENSDVHAALCELIARHETTAVDFGFDVAAWKQWLMNRHEIQNFNPRRDE